MDGIQTLFRLAGDRDTAPLGAEVLSRSGLGGRPCSGCGGAPRSRLGGAPHSERATRSGLDGHIIQPDR